MKELATARQLIEMGFEDKAKLTTLATSEKELLQEVKEFYPDAHPRYWWFEYDNQISVEGIRVCIVVDDVIFTVTKSGTWKSKCDYDVTPFTNHLNNIDNYSSGKACRDLEAPNTMHKLTRK